MGSGLGDTLYEDLMAAYEGADDARAHDARLRMLLINRPGEAELDRHLLRTAIGPSGGIVPESTSR